MSAFHRIDNMYDMQPTRFFRFALRLPAYRGVLRSRIEAEESKKSKHGRKMGSSEPARVSTYKDPAVSQYFDEG